MVIRLKISVKTTFLQQNDRYTDALKGIGILAVILGHLDSPMSVFIFSWHMPLFFFLSGFFIKIDSQVTNLITKDLKRLMIPFFVFGTLALGIEVLKRLSLNRPELNLVNELIGLYWTMDMKGLSNHYGFVLWFLPALFWGRNLLRISIVCFKNRIWMTLIFSILLFILSFYVDLPFGLDNGLNAIVFIFLGFFYNKLPKKSHALYLMILVPVIYLAYGFPGLDMANKFYSNVVVNYLWAIGIISGLMALASLRKYDILDKLGVASMFLFILHPYTNNVSHLVVQKYFNNMWFLKFVLTLGMLFVSNLVKDRLGRRGILKYV